MSEMSDFADRIAKAARRAEFLRVSIEWMEENGRVNVLTEPRLALAQDHGSALNGYWQAMELLEVALKARAEAIAKECLASAKKELVEIETMFEQFTKLEPTP